MKYICTSLYFFVVVALIGWTAADEEGGEVTTETLIVVGHACDVEQTGNSTQDDLANILMDRLLLCLNDERSDFRTSIQAANTTEEYRSAMKNYCDDLPAINSCMADVTTMAGRCLNDTSRLFEVVDNDLEVMLSVMCKEDGVNLASLIEEARNIRNGSEQQVSVEKCLQVSLGDIMDDLDESNPSLVSVGYYRMFHGSKVCLLEASEGHSVLSNLIDSTFGELLKKLKCIHPESDAEVLCDTFVDL